MADQFIDIVHPGTKGKARVTKRSFEQLWQEKGWVQTSDEPFDVASARKPALVERAKVLGIDTSGTAEDLRGRITAHEEGNT